MATMLTAGLGLLSACTSGDVVAADQFVVVASPTSADPSAAGLGCARVDATGGGDALTLVLTDVWPVAGGHRAGGSALTDKDLRACPGSGRPASYPSCQLGFPWRNAARADADLADLGVIGVQLKQLVKTKDLFVTETILTFGGPRSSGEAQLVRESIGCAQGDASSQGADATLGMGDAGATTWIATRSGNRLAVVDSGNRLVAVEFTDASLKQTQLQVIVDKAVKLSAKLS